MEIEQIVFTAAVPFIYYYGTEALFAIVSMF